MNKTKIVERMIKENFDNVRNFSVTNDIPYTTVRSVLERGIDNSGVNTVLKILKALNISIDKLSEMENRGELYVKEDIIPYIVTETKPLPIVGIVRAGEPILATENIEGYFAMDSEVLSNNKEYFMLRVQGDSMDREFQQGSLLLIEKDACIENGDIAVVLVNGDEATVKRFYRNNGLVKLVPNSTNPSHFEKIINTEKEEINIIGKVKMAIKQY